MVKAHCLYQAQSKSPEANPCAPPDMVFGSPFTGLPFRQDLPFPSRVKAADRSSGLCVCGSPHFHLLSFVTKEDIM